MEEWKEEELKVASGEDGRGKILLMNGIPEEILTASSLHSRGTTDWL